MATKKNKAATQRTATVPGRRGWRPGKYLFYGVPKVGKSTWLRGVANDGGIVHVDLEGSAGWWAAAPGVQTVQADSLDALRALRLQLTQQDKKLQAVILDTLNVIYGWLEQVVCRKLEILALGQARFGSDFGLARKYLMRLVSSWHESFPSVIWVAHAKQLGESNNGASGRITVDLPGQVGRTLQAALDHVGYIGATSGATEGAPLLRWVDWGSTPDLLEAGSRAPSLAGKRQTLPLAAAAITTTTTKKGAAK